MTLREQQSRFVEMVGKLIQFAYAYNYELTFGDTYPGKYPHNPNGFHPKGLAIDLNLFKDGKWLKNTKDHAELGKYWKSIGGSWGGDWGDGNHYSLGEREN